MTPVQKTGPSLTVSALAVLGGTLSPSWGVALAIGGALAVVNVWILMKGEK